MDETLRLSDRVREAFSLCWRSYRLLFIHECEFELNWPRPTGCRVAMTRDAFTEMQMQHGRATEEIH